jgi:hypothetical protein
MTRVVTYYSHIIRRLIGSSQIVYPCDHAIASSVTLIVVNNLLMLKYAKRDWYPKQYHTVDFINIPVEYYPHRTCSCASSTRTKSAHLHPEDVW